MIFVVALLPRLALFLVAVAGHPGHAMAPDSSGYWDLGLDFVRSTFDHHQVALSVLRTPGYPALIAIVRTVGGGIRLLVLVQCVLGALSAVLAAWLGYRIGGVAVGVVAGLVVAIDPTSIISTQYVLTETVYTFLLLGSVLLFLRALEKPSLAHAASAGLVLAGSVLVRPLGLWLTPVLVAVWVFRSRREVIGYAAVLLVAFIIPLACWGARNVWVADYPGISSVQDETLLSYRAAPAMAYETGVPRAEAQARLAAAAAVRAGSHPTVGQLGAARRAIAIAELKQHPIGLIRVTVVGLATILFGSGAGTLGRLLGRGTADTFPGFIDVLLVVPVVVAYLFAFLALLRRPAHRYLWLLVAIVLYGVVAPAGGEAYSRFRVPVMPFVGVLAGIGALVVQGRRHDVT
jgi:4-amino-4-deoxy-L-arabinose transferase-like glycosyltransferase